VANLRKFLYARRANELSRGLVMRIGLPLPLPAYTIDPAFMHGRTAERLGFESIRYAEHPAVPVEAPAVPRNGGAIPSNYSHFTEPYIARSLAALRNGGKPWPD
jgi:hypothetical protein